MVSVIQLTLCVHVEPKSKQQYFFLRCHLYSTQRLELFESFRKVDSNFLNLNEKDQVYTLLYGS